MVKTNPEALRDAIKDIFDVHPIWVGEQGLMPRLLAERCDYLGAKV